ncbi:MAG: tetratricopeptide repeat protein [Elainella sp. Prado103]|nr:tetratricopeptide repeat protein [Elainella sp. Prado103]
MKKNSWLNALENVSLVGLGAGSVASIILQQIFYTTAPLSLLVVLGILHRRKLTQLNERQNSTFSETDQYLALQLDRLHHQMASLPTSESINRINRNLLVKNQELSDKVYHEVSTLKQGVHQRLAAIEQQGLGAVRQEVRQLMGRCNDLMETVNHLGADVGNLSAQVRTDSVRTTVEQLKLSVATLQTNLENLAHQTKPNLSILQEHITRLDRQFSKLPPPVDLTSLKQEVSELIKIVADLVPRRDLSSLMGNMSELRQQQETLKQSIVAIETAALNFKRSLSDLPRPLEAAPDFLREVKDPPVRISGFGDRELAEGSIGTTVYPELQEITIHYFETLQAQIQQIQELSEHLTQQQQQLRDQVGQFHLLDMVALQRQLGELAQRFPHSAAPRSEGMIPAWQNSSPPLQAQVETSAVIPQSELIFDFAPTESEAISGSTGSRAVLEQALEITQQRLILIWPWADRCRLDTSLCQKLDAFLQQKRQLEIGWCYLSDRNEERWLSKMQRGWMSDFNQRSLVQETLQKLLQLKRRYPQQFQFKILGTSENFLVSDQSFAVLGITDALQTTTPFSELQLKLKTTDPSVIQRLIRRFDDSTLADDDLTSYWNRAVTRYDLGDKTGAITDFTHILRFYPDDAIAYNHRGLAHYDLGDLTSALTDFAEAIQINPQQPTPYCNRGFIRAEQGDYREAIDDYTQALQVYPAYAIAYFYRGIAQQKLENYSAALTDLSDAIRFAPDSPVAYYYRGLTWQKLENLPEAIADFELAAQFFWVRGNKANAQKAQANVTKLRQALMLNVCMPASQAVC